MDDFRHADLLLSLLSDDTEVIQGHERMEATGRHPMVKFGKGRPHNDTLSGMHGTVSWTVQGRKSIHLKGA